MMMTSCRPLPAEAEGRLAVTSGLSKNQWTGPDYDAFSANMRGTISDGTAALGEVAGRVG